MLSKLQSNAYFLAKFRFDTAENEPAKNLPNFADSPRGRDHHHHRPRGGAAGLRPLLPGGGGAQERRRHVHLRRAGGRQAISSSGSFFRARSRLYRSQILQVNMRWEALAEIYAMPAFAPWKCIWIFSKKGRAQREKFFSFFKNLTMRKTPDPRSRPRPRGRSRRPTYPKGPCGSRGPKADRRPAL